MALLSLIFSAHPLDQWRLYVVITGRHSRWLILLPVLAASLMRQDVAKAAQISEYEVKAAFLLNFTKFVEWKPDAFTDANSPLEICILGPDLFGSTIDSTVANETIHNRRLVVRRISEVPPAKSCQVVFITRTGRGLRGILRKISPGVLTVGEADDFIASGGMIRFMVDDRRVRFEIARGVVERMGLQMSSQLLKVARAVR